MSSIKTAYEDRADLFAWRLKSKLSEISVPVLRGKQMEKKM
jgi:hypothetical protein